MRIGALCAVAAAVGLACGDDSSVADGDASADGSSSGDTSMSGTAPVTTMMTGDTGTTNPGSSSTADGSDSSGDDASSGGVVGCDEIDILFVVDHSAMMDDEQDKLIVDGPVFLADVQAALPDSDLHIGVTPVEEYVFNLPYCQQIGGLVVETGGFASSDMACGPYANGLSFMTAADDLATAFPCAAQPGANGPAIERPMEAMLTALGPDLAVDGQCNEDFLRNDALLVVVLLTDEEDGPGDPEGDGSAGSPQTWFDDLSAVKGGQETRVVMTTITTWSGGPCDPPVPANDAQNVMMFGDMWTYGAVAGACEANYATALADTLANIETACAQ